MDLLGNSTLLMILLAALIAGTGYAAGRAHQRYRTGRDRDAAYRDGYDTASRSVFSLAARLIGPRRERAGVRGSASVPGVVVKSGGRPSPPVAAMSSGADGVLSSGRDGSAGSPSPVGGSGFPVPGRPSPAAVRSDQGSSDVSSPDDGDGETGRHTVPEELVRAATYRLAPDRVARAKVPKVMPGEPVSDGASSVGVPKPRSS